MYDPFNVEDHVAHIILHAWVNAYLTDRPWNGARISHYSAKFEEQSAKLRDSAIALQAALEKMRAANEKLAQRMAEHKAFFAKYQNPPAA